MKESAGFLRFYKQKGICVCVCVERRNKRKTNSPTTKTTKRKYHFESNFDYNLLRKHTLSTHFWLLTGLFEKSVSHEWILLFSYFLFIFNVYVCSL